MGEPQIDMDLEAMNALIDHMHQLSPALFELTTYLREEVCNTTGFTGLMSGLGSVLNDVAQAGSTLHLDAACRWEAFTESVRIAAHDLDLVDGESSGMFDKTTDKLPRRGELRAV